MNTSNSTQAKSVNDTPVSSSQKITIKVAASFIEYKLPFLVVINTKYVQNINIIIEII